MRRASPNRAHYALAELEHAGAVNGLITQNVDGLHVSAGSKNVLALHGDLSSILCLDCGTRESRESLDIRLDAANPGYLERLESTELQVNPDGDVELDNDYIRNFQMVGCTVSSMRLARCSSNLSKLMALTSSLVIGILALINSESLI